jgi:hypothetical protein
LIYTIDGVDFSMRPSDKFEVDISEKGGQKKKVEMSFVEYLKYRHDVEIKEESEPPMLIARLTSGSFDDLLHPPEVKKGKEQPSTKLHLIPSMCIVSPFPLEIYRTAEQLPSIMHRIEQFCLVDEFRLTLGLSALTNATLYESFSSTVYNFILHFSLLAILSTLRDWRLLAIHFSSLPCRVMFTRLTRQPMKDNCRSRESSLSAMQGCARSR